MATRKPKPVDESAALSVVVIDCGTGNTTSRPFTEAELAAIRDEAAAVAMQPPSVPHVDPLDELRNQVAELQALVAALTKGVQTAP